MDEPRQDWQVSLYLISEKPTGKKTAFLPADFVESFIDDISKQKFLDFWEFSTYPLPHPRPQVHVLQSALIWKKQGLLTTFVEVWAPGRMKISKFMLILSFYRLGICSQKDTNDVLLLT